MNVGKLIFSAALCSMCLPAVCFSQAPNDPTPCPAAPATLNPSGKNIFNDQQEQYLGDSIAEWLEPDHKLIPHSGENDYLADIGQKLLAALPPSGLHFQFRLYDSGELNAFSVAGGRVYISRKLVTAANTEDDIAGVIAHELGHLFTHQTAIDMTQEFGQRLGVTSVTDRADIFARFHQLIDTPPKHASDNSKASDQKQDIADQVAIYALMRAGYHPGSFATFFDMLSDNHGKTGGALSDFFGITKADSKRYRAALRLVAAIPTHCASQSPSSSSAFAAWRQSVIERKPVEASTPAADEKVIALDPPLRADLDRIRFSPDGRYLLAQDESTIFVSSTTPLKFLFRIDALESGSAHFTPDSQRIVFHDDNLRVEEWSIADQKRLSVHEIIFPKGCRQTALSPNGKLLVCAGIEMNGDLSKVYLDLLSVENSAHIYENNSFYAPGALSSDYELWQLFYESVLGHEVVSLAFSADGRYLVASAGTTTIGYDLTDRHLVALGGGIQSINQAPFTFVGSDRVAVFNSIDPMKSAIYAFPRGSRVQPFSMGKETLDSVTQGDAVILRPLKDYAAGILDIHTNKFIIVSKVDPLDLYGHLSASESVRGSIEVADVGAPMQQLDLPISALGKLTAEAVSPDGKYLSISGRTRAATWDLTTGQRVILSRPFSGAYIDASNQLYANYPKFRGADPMVGRFDPKLLDGQALDFKLPEHAWQYGDLILQYKPLGRNKSIDRNAILEIHGITDNALLWNRNFPQETPACWIVDNDRAMILAWDLDSAGARTEIKGLPALAPEIAALKDRKKGLLLEIVDKRTGQGLHQLVVPERDLTEGRYDTRRGVSMGDFVLMRGEQDNTVIYRVSDGTRTGEVFGSPVAQNADLHLFCTRNRENELTVYDAETAKEQHHYTFDSPVRFAAFQPAVKSLFVLTADQKIHTMPLAGTSESTTQVAGAAK
jgi:hypothetical protein